MIFPFGKSGGHHDISKVESLNGSTITFITASDSAMSKKNCLLVFSYLSYYKDTEAIYKYYMLVVYRLNIHRKILADNIVQSYEY